MGEHCVFTIKNCTYNTIKNCTYNIQQWVRWGPLQVSVHRELYSIQHWIKWGALYSYNIELYNIQQQDSWRALDLYNRHPCSIHKAVSQMGSIVSVQYTALDQVGCTVSVQYKAVHVSPGIDPGCKSSSLDTKIILQKTFGVLQLQVRYDKSLAVRWVSVMTLPPSVVLMSISLSHDQVLGENQAPPRSTVQAVCRLCKPTLWHLTLSTLKRYHMDLCLAQLVLNHHHRHRLHFSHLHLHPEIE